MNITKKGATKINNAKLDFDVGHIRPLFGYGAQIYDPSKFIADYKEQVNRAIKEKRFPQTFNTPVSCQLELTTRCTQKCLHCYNRSNECDMVAGEMSVDDWITTVKDLVKAKVFECIISGGEPLLLGDDLIRIMDILNDAGVTFVLITNGMLLTKEIMKKLRRYRYSWLQVSIDGLEPEVNDFIRQAPGSWHKAVNAAQMVKEAGIPLVISHVLTRHNVKSMGDMIDFSYYLGAKRVITGKFIYSGRAVINLEKLSLSASQVEEYNRVLKAKNKEYFPRMEVVNSLDSTLSFRMHTFTPTRTVLIRPNGDVRLDCALPFKIGNIREQSLDTIWQLRGKNAWKSNMLRSYAAKIRSEEDMLRVRPRSYVDPDILLEENCHES